MDGHIQTTPNDQSEWGASRLRLIYGKRAAFHIFYQFPGAWEIRQTLANKPANQFWNRVIHSYTEGMYREMILNEERWTGPIQVFGDELNNTLKSDSIQLL
ncbi:hypothetical protein ACINKY_16575 [Paenibacillus illinoisensis]|uniref:Uncharacterized protein n=1 Tax=Paenibacillus illinoisensis TaxID=59845 RepID=A0ABW8HW07_9BACL